MAELHTERLTLRPVDPGEAGEAGEAERIVARSPSPDDAWADDFPFDGDVIGATMFLRATRAHGDQQPFGHYVVVRTSDGRAVGGIGFEGQPENGVAEIGYGLAPSGRGNGFAAEAVRALVDLARAHSLVRLVADTESSNAASRQTLEHAGFTKTGSNGALILYEIEL